MDTDSAGRATRSPATWRSPTLAIRAHGDAFTAWPCGCLRGVTRRCAGWPATPRVQCRCSGGAASMWGLLPATTKSAPWRPIPTVGLRSSRGWATGVPAVHERRRPLDLTELARWCQHAGLPDPVAFRSSRTPLVPGALDLAPVEVNRPGRPALPYSHVELWFKQAIPGAGRDRRRAAARLRALRTA